MRIAITGTRGIPKKYGGFEKCAEKLTMLLVKARNEEKVKRNDKYEY